MFFDILKLVPSSGFRGARPYRSHCWASRAAGKSRSPREQSCPRARIPSAGRQRMRPGRSRLLCWIISRCVG